MGWNLVPWIVKSGCRPRFLVQSVRLLRRKSTKIWGKFVLWNFWSLFQMLLQANLKCATTITLSYKCQLTKYGNCAQLEPTIDFSIPLELTQKSCMQSYLGHFSIFLLQIFRIIDAVYCTHDYQCSFSSWVRQKKFSGQISKFAQ